MADFYAPDGNIEVWDEQPEGYCTEEEWQALHPELLPTLEGTREDALIQIASQTEKLIVAGFIHEVGGEFYHFSYDRDDQANFAEANAAALLALISQDTGYVQVWRGWRTGTPCELELGTSAYLTLARAAGDHKIAALSKGWEAQEKVREAQTIDKIQEVLNTAYAEA